MARSSKGSKFERDLCRTLTAWWTGDPDRDVVFWRTSQSGGRVTARARKGKDAAAAHVGDITAIDPIGFALTKLVTIEAKNGYNGVTISSLMDGEAPKKGPSLQAFIEQTVAAQEWSGTPHWMLIHKRDKREPMVFVNQGFVHDLVDFGKVDTGKSVRVDLRVNINNRLVHIVAFQLTEFLRIVKPTAVRAVRLYHKNKPK